MTTSFKLSKTASAHEPGRIDVPGAGSKQKLDLGIEKKKRLRQTLEVILTGNNQTRQKKVCMERVPEAAGCKEDPRGTVYGYEAIPHAHADPTTQHISSEIQSLRQKTAKSVVPLSSQTKIRSAIDYVGIVLQQPQREQLVQQPAMGNHLPLLAPLHNSGPLVDKDSSMVRKRKSVHCPRVSSGTMIPSSLWSKLGEISSNSVDGEFSAIATKFARQSLQENATSNSHAVAVDSFVASFLNDSGDWHHQTQMTAPKERFHSSIKAQALNIVAFPVTSSNTGAPMKVDSILTGTQPMDDQVILARFAKIITTTERYQLNLQKNMVDDYPAKEIESYFSLNAKDFKEQLPLSRSFVGGIDTCKSRQMTFIRYDHMHQAILFMDYYQLNMTETESGKVTIQYRDTEVSDLGCLLSLHTFPSTYHADLHAAQLCVLMERNGYEKTEDETIPIGFHINDPYTRASDNVLPEMKPPKITLGQQSNSSEPSDTNGFTSKISSLNIFSSDRMLASGNNNQTLPLFPQQQQLQQLSLPCVQKLALKMLGQNATSESINYHIADIISIHTQLQKLLLQEPQQQEKQLGTTSSFGTVLPFGSLSAARAAVMAAKLRFVEPDTYFPDPFGITDMTGNKPMNTEVTCYTSPQSELQQQQLPQQQIYHFPFHQEQQERRAPSS